MYNKSELENMVKTLRMYGYKVEEPKPKINNPDGYTSSLDGKYHTYSKDDAYDPFDTSDYRNRR